MALQKWLKNIRNSFIEQFLSKYYYWYYENKNLSTLLKHFLSERLPVKLPNVVPKYSKLSKMQKFQNLKEFILLLYHEKNY
jgi:hypothetical protein